VCRDRNPQFILSPPAGNPVETRMKQLTPEDHVPPRQAVRTRFLWFLAGAGVNYLLIATPFKWLQAHTALPIWAISACSLGVSTSFFFFWNYFINFRSDSRKRDALPRYLTAVACMWALSTATLTILKHFNARMAFSLGGIPLDLDIVATQFFLAGLKFFLYHKWVFPVPKEPGA
jgi:putative flippase GtrA